MAKDMAEGRGDCRNCGARNVPRLSPDGARWLAESFFVNGSLHRPDYGAAPIIQFNSLQSGSLDLVGDVAHDAELLEKKLGIGFFYYGPRLWMVGLTEPIGALQKRNERAVVINRIIDEFPVKVLEPDQHFYRVRKAPESTVDTRQYDAPPARFAGHGRLDAKRRPVLYGSQDLEVCVHECRFTAEDELYVATLRPSRPLRMLDLASGIFEEASEFESIDLAVHMLFLAGAHSYPISRAIAKAAMESGFDGIIYPSYFSMLHTGGRPFETMYGISLRMIRDTRAFEQSKIIPNLAVFGRPIVKGDVVVAGINRLMINQVRYRFSLGPADPGN